VNLHRNWSPPYFYFRSNWPTDLESASHISLLATKVSTKFKVDTTICWLVIALLLLIRYVTLRPWPLTFWLWSVVIHGGSRDKSPTKFEDPIRLSVLELWVLTSPVGYHWQCVCSHCACAVSRDLCIGANFSHIFEIPDPGLPIHYATFMALRLRQMELLAKTASVWPCAKDHTTFCVCAKSRQPWTMT